MTQYGTQIKFKTMEQFSEAWMYLMVTCQGFRYCNHQDELTIEAAITGDTYEDGETTKRLNGILESS